MLNQRGALLPILGVLIFLVLLLTASYYLGLQKGKLLAAHSEVIQSNNENYLNTVNHHTYRPEEDKAAPYLTFGISFPATYYAVSEEMLFDYKAPDERMKNNDKTYGFDELSLYTNFQPLYSSKLNDTSQNEEHQRRGELSDCIRIQASTGMTLDDWTNLSIGGYKLHFSNEETVKIGKYDVQKRRLTTDRDNIAFDQAFIQLPERVSYYFETCNTNSAKDLDIVLRYFDVKGI